MRFLEAFAATSMAASAALTIPAMAQEFPVKPVKVIMQFPAGTGPDATMRQIGDKLVRLWGQQVIVENRPGAHGWIAVGAAKTAPPDGYTLLLTDNLAFALQPHIFKKLPHDPVKDFEPVAPLYSTHFFVVVPRNSKWQNMTDLIAEAKAKNGTLTYGSSGVGSHMHLGAAMLEGASGVQMTHVPYKETPQVFVSVANGDLAWAFGSASTAGAMYRAQKVKFIALAAPQRHPSFPDVPTISEAGGPNIELKSWVALYAPRGTPKPIIDRVNADIQKALAEPDVQERLRSVGFSPWPGPAADVAKALQEDTQVYGEVARRTNISLE